jgi:hypothetical protein
MVVGRAQGTIVQGHAVTRQKISDSGAVPSQGVTGIYQPFDTSKRVGSL